MSRIASFKRELSRVFDDNLHTKQWHNYVDYTIIGLIIISTLEVFISTFAGVEQRFGKILIFIDIFTVIIFTIEVSLRIWCADLIDDKYKGFLGRIRYCCSFYGLIDILSTYPFYLSFLFPFPYTALKVLRIARLLRVFRYMHSFRLLAEAFKSKKNELWVSVQFLAIVTIILSLILFFVEHKAQPETYANGWDSVAWAFLQYVGDPGGFADNPPITSIGQIIAVLVGILGIAIFAVPAGLIGSGFTEVMEKEQKEEKRQNDIDKINAIFRYVQCRYTKYLLVPKYMSITDIQAQQGISQPNIIEAVSASDFLRLRNIATTRPVEEKPADKLVVECFPKNRPYGCCINRGSKVTIVSTSSCSEAVIGNFSYYLAMIGGFNYVSKEIEFDSKYPITYYNINDRNACPNLPLFLNDIDSLAKTEDSWVVFLLSASGGQEPVYPTQFHYIIGAQKGDETYNDPNITIKDVAVFDAMYNELTETIQSQFGLNSDRHKYYGSSPRNISRHICQGRKINAFTIRIAWSVTCWDYRNTLISKTMADIFNKHFEPEVQKEYSSELTIRKPKMDYGYTFYSDLIENEKS